MRKIKRVLCFISLFAFSLVLAQAEITSSTSVNYNLKITQQETASKSDTIYDHDVGVFNFTLFDTIYVGDSIRLHPGVKNYGRFIAANFPVTIVFYSEDSLPVYEETIIVMYLPVSDSLTLGDYGTREFSQPGTYVVMKCSTMLYEDENPANDGGKKRAIVLPRPNLEEKTKGQIEIERNTTLKSTIMTVAQFKIQILNSNPRPKIYSLLGNSILLENINEGVYFLKTKSTQRKVILQ